jgi:cytochrome b involved in lipid metabolism
VHLDSAIDKQKQTSIKGSEAKDHAFNLQTNNAPGKNKDAGLGNGQGYISMQEVGQHHLAHDAWVVVDGKVYE